MNVVELILTALLVAVAATVVVRYVLRSLRVPEPDCGGCDRCPAHTPEGCRTNRRGDGT